MASSQKIKELFETLLVSERSLHETVIRDLEKIIKGIALGVESKQLFQLKKCKQLVQTSKIGELNVFQEKLNQLKERLGPENSLSPKELEARAKIEQSYLARSREETATISSAYDKSLEINKQLHKHKTLVLGVTEELSVRDTKDLVYFTLDPGHQENVIIAVQRGFEDTLDQVKKEYKDFFSWLENDEIVSLTSQELEKRQEIPKGCRILLVSENGLQMIISQLSKIEAVLIYPIESSFSALDEVLLSFLKTIDSNVAPFKLLIPCHQLMANTISQILWSDLRPNISLEMESIIYPIELEFHEREHNEYKNEPSREFIRIIRRIPINRIEGNVIIFLSNFSEMLELQSLLIKMKSNQTPVLIASLINIEEFKSSNNFKNKIILALNMAEISPVVAKNCSIVIDSGIEEFRSFDYEYFCYVYQRCLIDKTEATRRKNLAGKRSPGIAVRLYTSALFSSMRTHSLLGLEYQSLDKAQLASIFIFKHPLAKVPLLSNKNDKIDVRFSKSLEYLTYLDAVDDYNTLTQKGAQLLSFPLDVAYTVIMLASIEKSCYDEVLSIIAHHLFFNDSIIYLGSTGGFSLLRGENEDDSQNNLLCPEGVDYSGDLLTISHLYHQYKEMMSTGENPYEICETLCIVLEKVLELERVIQRVDFYFEELKLAPPSLNKQDSNYFFNLKHNILTSIIEGIFPSVSVYQGYSRLGYINPNSNKNLQGEYTSILSLNNDYPSYLVCLLLNDQQFGSCKLIPGAQPKTEHDLLFFQRANGLDECLIKEKIGYSRYAKSLGSEAFKLGTLNTSQIKFSGLAPAILSYIFRANKRFVKEKEDELDIFIEYDLEDESLMVYCKTGCEADIEKRINDYVQSCIDILEKECKEFMFSNNMRTTIGPGGVTKNILLFNDFTNFVVENLPPGTTDKQVYDFFNAGGFANILRVSVTEKMESCSAEVGVDDAQDALDMVEIYDSWTFEGNVITVRSLESKSKKGKSKFISIAERL
jgi:hypothetical protein